MRVLHFNPVNCKTGRLGLESERGTISLLSVMFLSMADDVFFRLPFTKVEEIKKTFRDSWISDADVLSFCDRLERYLKRKNMREQPKSGKLHTILWT